ncbi:MAG: PIN domain-containing protein [Nitrospiraceae bacterium]|nr:PIN domain-containing protein [Nitrospiraceae bacterium]
MKVLFDTNILLDLLLDRKPFSDAASKLFTFAEKDDITGVLCATTITTIYYLIEKYRDRQTAREAIGLLLKVFEIASVNRAVLETAIELNFKDFEDGVIYASAIHSGCSYVVTRNTKDFIEKNIPVFEPEEFIRILNA